MKLVAWLVLLPALLIVVAFAVGNRHDVALSFDPLPFALSAPLYALGLGFVLLGMLIGGFAASAKAVKWRRRARRAEREVSRLTGELKQAQNAAATRAEAGPPAISDAA